MKSTTSRPESIEDIRHGQRIPEDDTNELLRTLREGGTPPDMEDDPVVVPAKAPEIVPAFRVIAPRQDSEVPDVIARVLASPEGGELLEVARLLDTANSVERYIIFYTPIGDIRCRINWRSCGPESLMKMEEMFLIKIRSSALAFSPKPGAVFDIGFEDCEGRIKVTCLAAPQQLYPGVDLMCFLPHNPAMEKNGKLQEGAPSTVSGKPSTKLSEGEPVAEGEKAASVADFDTVRQPSSPT